MNTMVISIMLFTCLLLLGAAAVLTALLLVVSAAVGGCLLWAGQTLGAAVAANPVTLLVSGLLGLPGVAGIFILGFFL